MNVYIHKWLLFFVAAWPFEKKMNLHMHDSERYTHFKLEAVAGQLILDILELFNRISRC